MCFYYAIVKKNPRSLIKNRVITEKQLDLFNDTYLINGFENPSLPVIIENNELLFFEWGLVPSYINSTESKKEFRNRYNTLNAKCENIFTSKLFADSIIKRRCLVVCSGFFEWRLHKGKKYPYYISLKDDDVFVFGGIYNIYTDKLTGEISGSYSIITIPANDLMEQIHNTKKRMPLIIEPDKANDWLDPLLSENEIKEYFIPVESKKLKAYTIKKFVPSNTNENNTSELLAYYHFPELIEYIEGRGSLFDNY